MTPNQIKNLLASYGSDLVYILDRFEKLERVAIDAKLFAQAETAVQHKKTLEALNISFILLDK